MLTFADIGAWRKRQIDHPIQTSPEVKAFSLESPIWCEIVPVSGP